MKLLSEQKGIGMLGEIRSQFRSEVRENYEPKALSCSACPTPGICCRDEHFVNVHITRLEAAAISKALDEFEEAKRSEVRERIGRTVQKYSLDQPGDSFSRTYSCPLFEPGTGCLVHDTAKPLPCIAHACYENENDLPPDSILDGAERKVFELNRRVYGNAVASEPLPVAVGRIASKRSEP